MHQQFLRDGAVLRDHFGRVGPIYDYGPSPLLWAAAVWNDLHERWLAPRGMTLWDAIEQTPSEISSLLWGYLDGSSELAFRDVDGTDYTVVVTDVQEQITAITPDCESFLSVTLLEV